jgi:hypothetical protein
MLYAVEGRQSHDAAANLQQHFDSPRSVCDVIYLLCRGDPKPLTCLELVWLSEWVLRMRLREVGLIAVCNLVHETAMAQQ